MDELGKILRNHWKENLEIRKTAKFESDTFSASNDVAAKSCENFLGVGGGGYFLKEANGDVPLDGVAFSRLDCL